MAAGYLKIPYESVVVGYHNEKLPMSLTNKKMLPIVELDNGKVLNESLDIIQAIDKDQSLYNDDFLKNQKSVDNLINNLSPSLFKLSMPYMIWTPEFSPEAREYFQKKKEVKRGPFHELVLASDKLQAEFIKELEPLELNLDQFYQSNVIKLVDILIASHLWGMYLVPEFQFSKKIHDYLMRVKKETKFQYHIDYWNKPLNWSEFWQSL